MQSNPNGSDSDKDGNDRRNSSTPVEADALLQQGWQYHQTKRFDVAVPIFQQALSLYREIQSKDGEQRANLALAATFGDWGDNARSIEYYEQILTSAREDQNDTLECKALNGLGMCYRALGDFTKADNYFQQSLILAKQFPTRETEVRVLMNIGNNYYTQAKQIKNSETTSLPITVMRYPQSENNDALSQERSSTALQFFEEGIELYQKSLFEQSLAKQYQALASSIAEGDRETECMTRNSIGTIYRQLNQYTQALEYLQQALVLCQTTGDRLLAGTILNNIAIVYSFQDQSEKALEYYLQALDVSQVAGNKVLEGRVLRSIAAAYSASGNFQQAQDYLFKTLQVSRESQDYQFERTTLAEIGETYYSLANLHRSAEAAQFLQEGHQLLQAGNNPEALAKLAQALAIFDTLLKFSKNQAMDDTTTSTILGKAMSALLIGDIYHDAKQYQQALEYYQEALIVRQVNERESEATALSRMGDVYFQQGIYEKALSSFQEVLSIRRNGNDKSAESSTLAEIARIYLYLNKNEKALELYEQCLLIARELKDRNGEGALLNNLGIIYANQEHYQKAIDTIQQSLLIAREKNDTQEEARSLNNLGILHNKLKQKQKAQELFQQALVVSHEAHDQEQEQRATRGIEGQASVSEEQRLLTEGIKQIGEGKYETALETLQQALLACQADYYGFGVTMCLWGLGRAYSELRKYQQALIYFEQALEVFNTANKPTQGENIDMFALSAFGPSSGRAETLRSMGTVYFNCGQYQHALNYLQQALTAYREINYAAGEAQSLVDIGMIFTRSGYYQKALESFQQSTTMSKNADNRRIESNALNGIGIVYTALGQYDKALDFLQLALKIGEEVGEKQDLSPILLAIGDVYRKQEQYQQALDFWEQALTRSRTTNNRSLESVILNSMGVVYENTDQLQEALNAHLQALMINRQLADRYTEGYTLQNIGFVYDHLSRYPEAISYYTQALTIGKELEERSLEALVLSNRGNTYKKMGALADAEQDWFAAIELEEALRTELVDQNKVSLFDTQIRTYTRLQQLLIGQHKVEAALEIAERGRARAFAELLVQRLAGDNKYAEMLKSPTSEQIKQIARDHDTVLVEYSVIQEEKALYIWVIQPTGTIQFRQADLLFHSDQISSLSDAVKQTRESIKTRNIAKKVGSFRITNENLHSFYQVLVAPIANLLPSEAGSYVTFVPFGELLLLPFAALQDSNDVYLIEKYCISIVPSIHILGLTRERKTPLNNQGLLPAIIVGNPLMPTIPLTDPPQQLESLPEAEEEARTIATLLGTQPIIGSSATKKNVVEQMLSAQLIHLATHGLLDDIRQLGFPGAIALAPSDGDDGFLTTSEIMALPLHAQLAVLSACHTGGGQITGDGIVGLSRSFISAGIPTVIVSLWAVATDTAAELMTEFYRSLRDTHNKAKALQHSMLKVMKKDGFEDPKDWAAFILIGEAHSDQHKGDETSRKMP